MAFMSGQFHRKCTKYISEVIVVLPRYLKTPAHYLTHVDQSSSRSYGIHVRAISQEMHKIYIFDISLNIKYSKITPHLPGANELLKC